MELQIFSFMLIIITGTRYFGARALDGALSGLFIIVDGRMNNISAATLPIPLLKLTVQVFTTCVFYYKIFLLKRLLCIIKSFFHLTTKKLIVSTFIFMYAKYQR